MVTLPADDAAFIDEMRAYLAQRGLAVIAADELASLQARKPAARRTRASTVRPRKVTRAMLVDATCNTCGAPALLIGATKYGTLRSSGTCRTCWLAMQSAAIPPRQPERYARLWRVSRRAQHRFARRVPEEDKHYAYRWTPAAKEAERLIGRLKDAMHKALLEPAHDESRSRMVA